LEEENGLQVTHACASAAPTASEKVFSGQSVQPPEAAYLPAEQRQSPPAVDVFPAGQVSHTSVSAPSTEEDVPGAHVVQSTLPESTWNLPIAQFMQGLTPRAFVLSVPGVHGVFVHCPSTSFSSDILFTMFCTVLLLILRSTAYRPTM
jgi:hypothetical protein